MVKMYQSILIPVIFLNIKKPIHVIEIMSLVKSNEDFINEHLSLQIILLFHLIASSVIGGIVSCYALTKFSFFWHCKAIFLLIVVCILGKNLPLFFLKL